MKQTQKRFGNTEYISFLSYIMIQCAEIHTCKPRPQKLILHMLSFLYEKVI